MAATVAALDAGAALAPTADGGTAEFVGADAPDGFASFDMGEPGPDMRFLVRATPHGRIRLGENTERQEELREILAAGMQLSLLATLLTTALAGLWMARRAQARMDVIGGGLAAVARGDLKTRIALHGADDLSLLADRINATTARLDDAVGQMRVQSSNIAHDLRTPLARLRAQLETSLIDARAQGRAVDPETLDAALAQIDQITGTFEALLRLAQIESGAGRGAFATVDLGALVTGAAETFGPVVEDAGRTLVVETTDAARIHGDHDMLVQLLANLIHNALRHGEGGTRVALQAHGRRICVNDDGPGVRFAERENVLQPLYRGQASRQGEGFGLGLALVRAIAALHDADLALSDGPNGRGLSVAIRFPIHTDL